LTNCIYKAKLIARNYGQSKTSLIVQSNITQNKSTVIEFIRKSSGIFTS